MPTIAHPATPTFGYRDMSAFSSLTQAQRSLVLDQMEYLVYRQTVCRLCECGDRPCEYHTRTEHARERLRALICGIEINERWRSERAA